MCFDHHEDERIFIQPIDRIKTACRNSLSKEKIPRKLLDNLWNQLPNEYFQTYDKKTICRHTQKIVAAENENLLIDINSSTDHGGIEIFIYGKTQNNLFAITTAVLGQFHLNILDARILNCENNKTVQTYILLNEEKHSLSNPRYLQEMQYSLTHHISNNILPTKTIHLHSSRQLNYFNIPTKINFTQDDHRNHTIIEIQTLDKPGLLGKIASSFLNANILVKNAKILTLGERVEDIFFICDSKGNALNSDEQLDALKSQIIKALELIH